MGGPPGTLDGLRSRGDLAAFTKEQLGSLPETVRSLVSRVATGVLGLAVAGTGRKVAFGSSDLSFSANNDSAVNTVAHGLGTTPVVVVATPERDGGVATIKVATDSFDSDSFDLRGRAEAAITSTVTTSWVAIG